MAFGIGTNTGHPQHEAPRGNPEEVAVKCWFTSTGKAMPLMMKLQTAEEEIIEVDGIQVLTTDKQWYAGILNWKYRCRAVVQGQMMEFILLFCPESCAWKILYSRGQ